ncbi:MAG: hypothetical protein PHP44_07555 [Kiritimatiellae bacterium]|nr:hypothetical protein [Kiritimatiellia bacterium]MDD4735945.1 hypothetical protein [Kiritimatiellia bacterium]
MLKDDYKAKIKLWVDCPVVMPLPRIANLPPFERKCFSSYQELNSWKKAYREQIARNGGVLWTK